MYIFVNGRWLPRKFKQWIYIYRDYAEKKNQLRKKIHRSMKNNFFFASWFYPISAHVINLYHMLN